MKKLILCFSILFLILSGCDSILDLEEKPVSIERQKKVVIRMLDKTGTMQANYNTDFVNNVSVSIKSNSLQKELQLTSDDSGLVEISSFLSDKYLISCSRKITPDEMYKATGQRKINNRLVNFNNTELELNADGKDTIDVHLDKLVIDSPLLISEIYASGPTEAGLYFHDKYVEIYNQSDSTMYLDGLVIARVFAISWQGVTWVDDSMNVHSKQVWYFPGNGNDYPIEPEQFIVCAGDAIDHRINAKNSIDLSNADFEFYKADAPDIDNDAPNMIMLYQTSGVDWLIGGKSDALVLAKVDPEKLEFYEEHYLIPVDSVIDGVEYLSDVSRLDKKKLYPGVDAGATGGLDFYTGKTMERIFYLKDDKMFLKDNNNSSIDFKIYNHPSPGYHNEFK